MTTLTKSATFLILLMSAMTSVASDNFAVSGPYAKDVESRFEACRTAQYKLFLNDSNPKAWNPKAQVQVTGQKGGGGVTDIEPTPNNVKITCKVQGSLPVLLDDVVPHECFHMVVGVHFGGRFLPRWWNEGIATCMESNQTQVQHYDCTLYNAPKYFATKDLWNTKDYPQDVMLFYGQSHNQIKFLLAKNPDPTTLIRFMQNSIVCGGQAALKTTYNYNSLKDLEQDWLTWLPDYRKSCQCIFDEASGKWVCPLSIGHPRTVPAPTPNNPQPLVPVPPSATQIDQVIQSVKDKSAQIQQQIDSHQDLLQTILTKLGKNQEQIDQAHTKVDEVLTKVTAIATRIHESPITPIAEQAIATWVLPAILGSTGVGSLSGVLLFINALLKRKNALNALKVLKGGDPVSAAKTFQVTAADLIALVKAKNQQSNPSAVPLGRDQSEAVSLLQLAKLEGRNSVFDALVGRVAQDKIQNLIDDGHPELKPLLQDIVDTVNAITPLSV